MSTFSIHTTHWKLKFVFPIFLLLLTQTTILAQKNGLWTTLSETAAQSKGDRYIKPQKYQTLALNRKILESVLANTPSERQVTSREAGNIISLPLPDGTFARFRFVESATMAPDLAAQYPQIKTYTGQGVDDPSLSVSFDLTPAGFHGMIHSPKEGLSFIDPYSQGALDHYLVYAKKDYKAGPEKTFEETEVLGTDSEIAQKIAATVAKNRAVATSAAVARPSGDELRTYRLAVAATAEYTAFHGGTVAAALSAITTTINRVNFIYIREVAIRMQLVANNNAIIYTNAATDPYSNGNAGAMLSQNQTNLDAVIGNANYDIGHVFGTNSGGVAYLGVVCQTGLKAGGVTGSGAPIGDAFDVDYVAHEMGHQFGANHTFNGTSGACAGGNRNASTAFEPGSGSTIMGYAGICGAQDLQPNSDAYFHVASYDEIFAYSEIAQGNDCAVITTPINTAPEPTIVTPSGLTIPHSTPFTITGSATDFHNDPITYNWEEYDLGPAGHPDAPVGNAPIFRSFTATSSPSRTFPKLSDLLNNTHTIGELLPSYTRSLVFNLTVRDNYSQGGGVDWAYPLVINVTGGAGPFLVTAPNTSSVNWTVGSTQTINWDVAGTNGAPVNCASVKISLSTNGGNTFPIVLAASTPNDGAHAIVVPNNITNTARIKIEAVGNIFFDISNANFKIVPNPAPVAAWNKRFGGSVDDFLYTMVKTPDGGYLLGGYSQSGISGDKTQNSRGGKDFWVVKINAAGTKQWDKRFGGVADDILNAIVTTTDGGYLLGGSSFSGVGGDKTQASWGNADYWVVKINGGGTKQWDRRFGGNAADNLLSLIQIPDGYLLGGYSQSNISGDKTQNSRGGNDYWVVKIFTNGTKAWDRRFGGTLDDQLRSAIRNADGSFVLAGLSYSGIGGDKTQNSRGNSDFWIVKINSVGTKLWDYRFGGTNMDFIGNIVATSDGGYLLSGGSLSGIGGDKTQASRGGADYWVVKINGTGTKLWDRRFGGTAHDNASSMILTSDNGFLLGGWSASGTGGDKIEASQGGDDYWVVKINSVGTKLWDKRFGSTLREEMGFLTLLQNADKSYVIGGSSNSGIGGDKTEASRGGYDFWVVRTSIPASREAVIAKAHTEEKTAAEPLEDLSGATGTSLQIEVFPNPFSDQLTVRLPVAVQKMTGAKLQLFTLEGTLMYQYITSAASGLQQVDIKGSHLKNGVYILQLTTPTGVVRQKVIHIQ